jgi:uncharacterized protein (TIGR02452 family)
MSLKGVAKETMDIIERGAYTAPSGRRVDLTQAINEAVAGTVLYRPSDFGAPPLDPAAPPPAIEVTSETTGAAARRVVSEEGPVRVVALNFASAKNPGGGFLGGAKAQEEDLARCSALYPCLLTQRDYYEANRGHESLLYTDHIIYSPDVPFFRDERLDLLEDPFRVSILTAPAPNAGEVLRRDPAAGPRIRAALNERAAKVLWVMARQGRRVAILGAWGCGVFRNEPRDVADTFARLLLGPYRGAFDRAIFPVYDRTRERTTLRAFQERLT